MQTLPPAPAPSPWRTVAALAEILNRGCETHPTFSEDGIRHLVRQAATNGLAPHIRRLGAKVLVHEPGFLAWIEAQPNQRQRQRRRGRA